MFSDALIAWKAAKHNKKVTKATLKTALYKIRVFDTLSELYNRYTLTNSLQKGT